jgi:hypothetical protein
MGQILHGSATTTEAVRRAIQNSQASLRALSKRYGINPKTVAKWNPLIALAIVLACSAAIADDMKMPINAGDLKWGLAPPTLPKGAEIAVLSGDPLQRWSLRYSPKSHERL